MVELDPINNFPYIELTIGYKKKYLFNMKKNHI